MKKIIVIGAGPAGLTAAYELLKKSEEFEVTILEETGEIGGISRTVRYHGNRMDIGGHRFFSKDDRIMDWWQQIMPLQGAPSYDDKKLGRERALSADGPDPEKEDRVMLLRSRVSRIYYRKKFFDYPISFKPRTFINMGFVQTVKAGCSYLTSCLVKKKEDCLENFYINRFGRVLYSMFFESYTEKLWGRHPSKISADWGAQRVKGLSVTAVLKDMVRKLLPDGKKDLSKVETSLIEEFYYPKLGPGQLWETAAGQIETMGGAILKNRRVTRIYTEEGRITGVGCTDDSGEERFDCDILISSMPLKDLVAGMEAGQTVVPADIRRIGGGLPYRDFVTVGVLVKKLNLKNKTKIKTINDQIPDCWIYVQDAGVKMGRIQVFNNWSPYLVKDVENSVWIGLEYFCNEGDAFWNMSTKDCVKFAVRELLKMGVISGVKDVLDVHRERVKKAYPAYFDTYEEIGRLVAWLDGFENLFCVGRNGQHRYNNMDHSMATAMEAVDNILKGIVSKENIWKVNTEKEYHETK